LPETIIREIEGFFVDYNKLEDKKFKVLGRLDAKYAEKNIREYLSKKM
jgi:inorganic pyrophosphatase